MMTVVFSLPYTWVYSSGGISVASSEDDRLSSQHFSFIFLINIPNVYIKDNNSS